VYSHLAEVSAHLLESVLADRRQKTR
jgi:hypothetical protein